MDGAAGRSPAAMETEGEGTPELMKTAEPEEAMSDEMRSLAARMREEEEEDAVAAAEDEILAQIEKLVKVITQVKERIPPVGSQEEEAKARKGKRKLKEEEEEATWTVIPIEEKETVEGNRKIEGGIVKVEPVMAPAWLPPEWLVITRRRKSGRSKGNKDKYYYAPITLRRFRSRTEVESYISMKSLTIAQEKKDENPPCKSEASGTLHSTPLIQQVGEWSSVSTSTEDENSTSAKRPRVSSEPITASSDSETTASQ